MNGQMMNYSNYQKSLLNTPDPNTVVFKPLCIDYNGLIDYARSKGVLPCDLPDNEKNMFILSQTKN